MRSLASSDAASPSRGPTLRHVPKRRAKVRAPTATTPTLGWRSIARSHARARPETAHVREASRATPSTSERGSIFFTAARESELDPASSAGHPLLRSTQVSHAFHLVRRRRLLLFRRRRRLRLAASAVGSAHPRDIRTTHAQETRDDTARPRFDCDAITHVPGSDCRA